MVRKIPRHNMIQYVKKYW